MDLSRFHGKFMRFEENPPPRRHSDCSKIGKKNPKLRSPRASFGGLPRSLRSLAMTSIANSKLSAMTEDNSSHTCLYRFNKSVQFQTGDREKHKESKPPKRLHHRRFAPLRRRTKPSRERNKATCQAPLPPQGIPRPFFPFFSSDRQPIQPQLQAAKNQRYTHPWARSTLLRRP